jgi:ABC-type polysaccharide/polyol phosphate export permease
MFYLTPIFYAPEKRMSAKYLDLYFTLNPFAVILTLFRSTLMGKPLPSPKHIVITFLTCVLIAAAGYLFFKKNEDAMVKRI